MKLDDFVNELTNIDDKIIEESAEILTSAKRTHNFSKKIIAIAVAAVLVMLTAVVCIGYDVAIIVDPVENDLFLYDGRLEKGEVRLKEICEEYGIPTDIDITGGYWLDTKYSGDYYYEYGYVKTASKIFAFYLTNDDESEIKMETHQYLCNEDIDEFKADTEYVKSNGTTVIIHDVEEGWKVFGSQVYFSGEAINEYGLPFAENMWYGKLYGGGGYSRLNDKATEFAESYEDVIRSDSYKNEFVNR
ncbi:MAG: hypothetical protein IJ424_04440 [Oscillospiraceae bacterium]|nr:hypothetical protein [Oscillospiraceae bacterium]